MGKAVPEADVLVLGSHPSAYFAAALLQRNSTFPVGQVSLPGDQSEERLVVVNPALFELDDSLASLRRTLSLTPFYGLRFLSDDPTIRSEFQLKSISAYIASFRSLTLEMKKMAEKAGVTCRSCRDVQILRVDEQGIEMQLDGKVRKPKLLIISGALPHESRRVLGLPLSWDRGVVHRYTFTTCPVSSEILEESGGRPMLPMSLDLGGALNWAWMLTTEDIVQFAVEQPLEAGDGSGALDQWIDVLHKHGVLKDPGTIDASGARSVDLPFAGALAQEGVANRTLLIGPAGGFVTACAEDIYPGCWSSVFAVEVSQKALKERHLQDALQSYRHRWGATLGDYLRGPQQNLRFLLPLVYRNKVMTARLAEAILFGKSVVR